MREVATLSRLQHPNIVRYFQVGARPARLVQPAAGAVGNQRAVLSLLTDVKAHSSIRPFR
jgi:hypothetical protein